MSNNLKLPPTINIIDTSKLNAYNTCPRKYFFRYILGWRPTVPSHDLLFGDAFHLGLETIYNHWKTTNTNGYTYDLLLKAYDVFLNRYRESYPEETDEDMSPKNPENYMTTLIQYAEKYAADSFKVEYVEVAGHLPVAGTFDIYFRLDTIIKEAHGYLILEHKTSKWDTARWASTFDFALQLGTSQHALKALYGPDAQGIIVNGVFFRKPPRIKKDGQPYANSGPGNEFLRLEKNWSDAQMFDWELSVCDIYTRMIKDLDLLMNDDDEKNYVQRSFPKNENACFNYNRECPYKSLCATWMNPMARQNTRPCDMIVDHWDPRKGDKEYTKEVIL